VNGLTFVILLQDKNTWSLVIFRIIFYHHGVFDPSDDIPNQDTIRGTIWLTHDAMHLPRKTKALFELAGHGTSTVTLDVHNELLNGFLGNGPWHVSE
jgi:hypothetical protein